MPDPAAVLPDMTPSLTLTHSLCLGHSFTHIRHNRFTPLLTCVSAMVAFSLSPALHSALCLRTWHPDTCPAPHGQCCSIKDVFRHSCPAAHDNDSTYYMLRLYACIPSQLPGSWHGLGKPIAAFAERLASPRLFWRRSRAPGWLLPSSL